MKHTILYYTDSTEFGGAERVLLLLLEGLDRERWEPVLAHPPAEGIAPLLEGARRLDVPLWEVPAMPEGWRGAWRAPRLAWALRGRRPDVFHAHLSWPRACKYGLMAAVLARIPAIVATEHLFVEVPPDRLAWWQQRLLGAGIDCYVMVSQEVASRVKETYRVPERKIRLIPNGITADPPAASSDTGPPAGWPADGRPVILTAARLEEQKGHRFLLEAAGAVPEAVFLLAGEGAERTDLEARAQALGLSERVRFLGYRQDIPALLAACDLFVLPSLYEGLPLSVLEAMAAGKPVIATDIGGTREAIDHDGTGLLVPPADPAALAAAIRRVLGDPVLAARLAAAGQARVRAEFTADVMVRRMSSLYEELVGAVPGP